MKSAAEDLVCLDGTYGKPIECIQLRLCQLCDPRRIGQHNECRLPRIQASLKFGKNISTGSSSLMRGVQRRIDTKREHTIQRRKVKLRQRTRAASCAVFKIENLVSTAAICSLAFSGA